VTEPEFFFALEFSSQGAPAPFLEELAANLLLYVGCSREHVPELTQALKEALTAGARGERRCDVRFSVRDSTLEILVTSTSGLVWETSLPVP
jgi:hypothetical protein